MDAAFLALLVIVAVALAFDYTNGFHDAANAIAVAVSTKALTPRVALALAAVMNLVGALISTKVAKNGAAIGGDIKEVVVVRVNPGYSSDPGHPATGSVVAVLCRAT